MNKQRYRPQALDALETCRIRSVSEWEVREVTPKIVLSAINALRAAIAQPEAEPVAHQFQAADGTWHPFLNAKHYENTVADGRWPIRALYTSPPDTEALRKELERVKGARHLLLGQLILTKHCLEQANNDPEGPISDTIWFGPAETLFDYIDAAIASQGEQKHV